MSHTVDHRDTRGAAATRAMRAMLAAVATLLVAACSPSPPPGYQGYVEGEFVNVGSPIGGRLDKLAVARGDRIATGAPLFVLESDNEAAARAQAEAQQKAAEAQLADLRTGKRPPEQEVTAAQLAQAQAEAQRTALGVARDEAQYRVGGISRQQLEDSHAAAAANDDRVRQLQSELAVARLPSRNDQIAAQTAQVAAARAAVAQAAWRLDQKAVASPRGGLVYDTLYQPGEYVNAGNPIVRLLPPENVKVRFFVPEGALGGLHAGQAVTLRCDGCAGDIAATISYVSGEAEFTPPIIYSNETRGKLVFMVEARPAQDAAPKLHPGQPVTVVPH
jgi:HlyD family secretion protein